MARKPAINAGLLTTSCLPSLGAFQEATPGRPAEIEAFLRKGQGSKGKSE